MYVRYNLLILLYIHICFNFLVIKSRKYFFHLKQKRAIIIANVYSYIRGMQLVLSYGLLTLMKCKINLKKLKKTFCFLICRKFYFMYIRPFNSRPSTYSIPYFYRDIATTNSVAYPPARLSSFLNTFVDVHDCRRVSETLGNHNHENF